MMTSWLRLKEVEPGLAAELVDRVALGAGLLDRIIPGWAGRVVGERLAMETCDRCVLGQIHGEYLQGLRAILRMVADPRGFSGADHGFTLRDAEQDCDLTGPIPEAIAARLEALADLWRAALLERASTACLPGA